MAKDKTMKVEMAKVADLIPATYNPRVIDPHVLEKLKKGLQEFGFVEPLVVNTFQGREGVIIGGHQRLKAALELGYEEVPVNYVSLDEKREKALNIALNKLAGEWDFPKLTTMLKELESDLDFDLELTGFDKFEATDLGDLSGEDETSLFDMFSGAGPENSSRLNPAKMTIVSVGAYIQGVKQESADDEYASIHHELRDLCGRLQVEGTDEEKIAVAIAVAKAAYKEMKEWEKAKA